MKSVGVICNIIGNTCSRREKASPCEACSHDSIIYLRRSLLRWWQDNHSDFPWRTEHSQFHALIAEILLQRTRAEQVAMVFHDFTVRFPTPEALAEASVSDIETEIYSLGLRWRAKSLSKLGKRVAESNGVIPTDIQQLLKLPGVGPYVASAFLSLHAGVRSSVVDSNVVRFYGRYFGFDTDSGSHRQYFVCELSNRITPARTYRRFNYALLDFCRTVCRPRTDHRNCTLAQRCKENRT